MDFENGFGNGFINVENLIKAYEYIGIKPVYGSFMQMNYGTPYCCCALTALYFYKKSLDNNGKLDLKAYANELIQNGHDFSFSELGLPPSATMAFAFGYDKRENKRRYVDGNVFYFDFAWKLREEFEKVVGEIPSVDKVYPS